MMTERRATFAKVLIEDGEDAKTIYSFRLEKAHWIMGIFASLAAIAVALIVLRGAVYASVQDVAGVEFKSQLEVFHNQAQPAIRQLIDERIAAGVISAARIQAERDHAAELESTKNLGDVAVALGKMEERLAAIERRLNRMEVNR